MNLHEQYMQRALALASRGEGRTSPNPLVGCVVVKDDAIIGEGWHDQYGQAHAEPNAIQDAITAVGEGALRGATLFVTLEPCNHHGQTPPCTQAIVNAGITTVVFAQPDPNPKAAGGGNFLQSQAVEVIGGVLQKQAAFQNRFFLHALKNQRPFVIAKSATSLDGRVATRTGHSQWISNEHSRQRAHELRQSVDAIVVGADTLIADDPSLTTRLPAEVCAEQNIRHPRPVILDSTGRAPLSLKLLSGQTAHKRPLFATTQTTPAEHLQALESNGVDVLVLPNNPHGKGLDIAALLQALGQQGIQSVLVEGGAAVQGSFRDAQLIDEVWAFIAPKIIGGMNAPAAFGATGSETLMDATQLTDIQVETLGDDVLVRGLVDKTTTVIERLAK